MSLPFFSWNLAWCMEKIIQTQLEHMSPDQLDAILRRFYAEARSKLGDDYSKSTLLGFRHSIERYLNAPPLNKGLKLSSDPRFKRSNEMLNAKVVSLKRHGKENVKNKPAIETEDLVRLKSSQVMSPSNPLGLLRNVWFHVILFFCRRGREGQRNQLQVWSRSNAPKLRNNGAWWGIKKSPRWSWRHSEHEKVRQNVRNRRYERRLQSLEALPHQVEPKVRSVFPMSSQELECRRQRLGWTRWRVKTHHELIVESSEFTSLGWTHWTPWWKIAVKQHPYTNHSLRATAITLWSNAGIAHRHMMVIAGHRNEQSLAHYNTWPSTTQLRNCSDVLSRSFNIGNVGSQPESSSAPVTVRQNNSVVVAQEKTASFLQSVSSNCTVHGSVNVILNNQNPW